MTRSIGVILLVIFLVLWGLLAISNFSFQFSGFVLGALAIGAGILIALGK